MTKTEIFNQLDTHYQFFNDYLAGLTTSQYVFSYQGKWDASQQLQHIIQSVKPLVKVFGMPPTMVLQAFGKSERDNWSYEVLKAEYLEKLKAGGKAPSQFLPAASSTDQRTEKLATLASLVNALKTRIANFEEADLESLHIPHPLLGNLTMKEMLYNCIYHVQHHQAQIAGYLEKKVNSQS